MSSSNAARRPPSTCSTSVPSDGDKDGAAPGAGSTSGSGGMGSIASDTHRAAWLDEKSHRSVIGLTTTRVRKATDLTGPVCKRLRRNHLQTDSADVDGLVLPVPRVAGELARRSKVSNGEQARRL